MRIQRRPDITSDWVDFVVESDKVVIKDCYGDEIDIPIDFCFLNDIIDFLDDIIENRFEVQKFRKECGWKN